MSTTWAKGSTRSWRRIRALVLTRDQGQCRLRLEGCTGQATHVHHTHGRKRTGDDMRYLVSACAACNLKVGEPDPDPEPKRVTEW